MYHSNISAMSSGARGVGSSGGPSGSAGTGDAPDKYIVKNGVKKMNPQYKEWQRNQNKALPSGHDERVPMQVANYHQPEALAIVSTPEDHQAAAQMCAAAGVMVCVPAESVTATEEIFEAEAHHFGVPGLDGEELLTGLYEKFAAWQVPRGYINKLALTMKSDGDPFPDEPKRIYLQDDSGSMNSPSDMKDDMGRTQTRFEEAKQRLLTHMEFLAHVPNTGKIKICFLNRSNTVNLDRPRGQTPEQFIADAQTQIDAAFGMIPKRHHLTPIPEKLGALIDNRKGKQSITLLFDGKPSDGGHTSEDKLIDAVKDKVLHRPDPQNCPITFLSCTENDSDVEWAKELEEIAPFCAEYDDYNSELKEVIKDQGKALPYSPGMKIIGEIVGAECPDDLDAWDESVPITQHTLENVMGETVTPEEYKYYYQHFEATNRDPQTGKDKNEHWKSRFSDFAVTERDNPHHLPLVAGQMPIVQRYREEQKQNFTREMGQGSSSVTPARNKGHRGMSFFNRH
jgi:hypothetical protein